MPTVTLKVEGALRELWVAASGREQVSLSEWIRRACDRRLKDEWSGPAAELRAIQRRDEQLFIGASPTSSELLVEAAGSAKPVPSPVAADFGNRERQGCPRQHFHSPGQWCKTCGRTT